MIDIVEKQGCIEHYGRIKKIYLEIGELANIERTAFEFCFSVISKNTILSDTLLEIVDIPGKGVCKDCGKDVFVHQWFDICPFCSGHQLSIYGGEELRIRSLELE